MTRKSIIYVSLVEIISRSMRPAATNPFLSQIDVKSSDVGVKGEGINHGALYKQVSTVQ